MAVKKVGGRRPGETNYTLREKRFIAQIDKLKADLAAAKAKVKVGDAEKREIREKLRVALAAKAKSSVATKKKAKKK